jgi:hypothetical protein
MTISADAMPARTALQSSRRFTGKPIFAIVSRAAASSSAISPRHRSLLGSLASTMPAIGKVPAMFSADDAHCRTLVGRARWNCQDLFF